MVFAPASLKDSLNEVLLLYKNEKVLKYQGSIFRNCSTSSTN